MHALGARALAQQRVAARHGERLHEEGHAQQRLVVELGEHRVELERVGAVLHLQPLPLVQRAQVVALAQHQQLRLVDGGHAARARRLLQQAELAKGVALVELGEGHQVGAGLAVDARHAHRAHAHHVEARRRVAHVEHDLARREPQQRH
eukprot:2054004-Prymnesium_polylepis.1